MVCSVHQFVASSRVYLETSVISYLTGLPSRDLVLAAHQQVTRDWWSDRGRFELFVSDAVLEEDSRGDSAAASRRAAALAGMPVLAATPDSQALADRLVAGDAIPRKAAIDAVHIAIAVAHGMDFLVTWNCTHIANAVVRVHVEAICREAGYAPPAICTPLELMAEEEP
jgi:hypothetical protein